ncbi:MAG: hypothetical protein IH955_10940 [Chloroflexi bacterium]|nr:hypothetical protein [Chloroflexota bacterium]
MKKPAFVTFVGGWGPTPVEQMMAAAHRAIAADLVQRAIASRGFDSYFLVTDTPALVEVDGDDVVVEPALVPFHFGRNLRDLVVKHGLERVCYVGGGALPLLSADDMASISDQLSNTRDTVITNNVYSGDLVCFTPASALERIPLPSIDNPLPRLLSNEGGLEIISLPRGLNTLMDVDTPTDLAILTLFPGLGPHLRAYLEGLDLDVGRLSQALKLFTCRESQVLVAGRIGSFVWSQLEQGTACRCRIISEERGMRTDGREGAGTVRSLLGQYLELTRPPEFFRKLAELGDAIFIDTRVLFRHLGLDLNGPDRFHSDMMAPEEISDPWAREFTSAAMNAPVPVVLGGHSLVTGGLLALIEIAWAGQVKPCS